MKKIVQLSLFLGIILLGSSCTHKHKISIDPTDTQISYTGRVDQSEADKTALYWSGSSIRFNFEGEAISAILSDETGDNYYNVIIDGGEPTILRPGKEKKTYLLASHLRRKAHSVELFKRTEWDRGTSWFHGFEILGWARVLPKDEPKKRKIEFYGNSISAGYAVDDNSGRDRSDSIFTNNYLSYAALTARHFDADYRCICKSGIGVMVSWFPLIMPEMYDRLDPSDPKSQWDFSSYTPDLVVINLFQNDSWLVNLPNHAQFKARFGEEAPSEDFIINAYADFVSSIRAEYPDCPIVCILGSMDATREGSPWPNYVEQAVAQLGDKNVYTHFIPFKNSGGHPNKAEQQLMADDLSTFIEAKLNW